MKKFYLILYIIGASVCAWAQDPGRAERLFFDGDYQAAYRLYRQLHANYPGTELYTYRLGRCEQELGNYEDAVQHLTEAGDRYSMRSFWLAKAAYPTYRFHLAKEMMQEWLETNEPTERHYAAAEAEMQKIEQGIRFMNRVENIAYIDTISFRRDSLAAHLPALSPDMGKIEIHDGLFIVTNERGDRRYLAFTDSLSGRRLIGRQEKLLDAWSPIDTLPASVNSTAEQDYPILMPDGVTLYYAARDTADGLGGWDIYKTKYNPDANSYLTPELLGMPFNSMADDMFFLYDEAADRGYYMTNRLTEDNRLMLCTFKRQDNRYLRDSSEAYLREYVQLRVLPKAQVDGAPTKTNEQPFSSVLAELETETPVWSLVINDSTVYTSLKDFQKEDAKKAMEEYLDLLDQIDEESEDLAVKRQSYAAASAEERALLAPLILSLEQDVRRLRKDAETQRKEAIRLEVD